MQTLSGGGAASLGKIMIVEDELLIADAIASTLENAGYGVCGIARTVSEALTLARLHRPNLAIIDLRLEDGELGTSIAPQLEGTRSMGILFACGDTAGILLNTPDGEACLSKPYSREDLLRSLVIVDEVFKTGKTSRPFPAGFQILAKQNSSMT
jgi:DNA-binding response OmpR family regulator